MVGGDSRVAGGAYQQFGVAFAAANESFQNVDGWVFQRGNYRAFLRAVSRVAFLSALNVNAMTAWAFCRLLWTITQKVGNDVRVAERSAGSSDASAECTASVSWTA